MANLNDITTFLDELLNLKIFSSDNSNNGLQIQGKDEISKIVFGVDISQLLIDKAIESETDMIFVHHGISWGDNLKHITNNNYRRVSSLIKNDISLYAAHLPLDAHPEVGHNAVIATMLNLHNVCGAFNYYGVNIGCTGNVEEPVSAEELAFNVENSLNLLIKEYTGEHTPDKAPYILDSGREIRSVGIVSGGGGYAALSDAINMNLDCLVTGEFNHSMYLYAKESGISVIAAGHYKTEIPGVIAIMNLLDERFNVGTKFVNLPTGL